MPFAVIGVLADATNDSPDAVRCILDAIETKEEAQAIRDEIIMTDDVPDYQEQYVERYDGARWHPTGGRCFVQAVRYFIAKHQDILNLQHLGQTPVLVHGSCELANPQSEYERSGHAWIEGENSVIDCGSYILKPKLLPKELFYENFKAIRSHAYVLDEAEKMYRETGLPYPWNKPSDDLPRDQAVWESLELAKRPLSKP